MVLKALCDEYKPIWEGLLLKLKERNLLQENGTLYCPSKYCVEDTYRICNGYGRNIYQGVLINELSDLSELEISMIMDRGYGHFGGEAIKYNGNTFRVMIYTD